MYSFWRVVAAFCFLIPIIGWPFGALAWKRARRNERQAQQPSDTEKLANQLEQLNNDDDN